MFNQLLDKIRENDIDLGLGEEGLEQPKSEFNEELISEYGLVHPKKEMSEYDTEQLDMGRTVETEHTDNPDLAVVIAANHLDEIPDYYTRLKAMEDEAKEEQQGHTDELGLDKGAELPDSEENREEDNV